MYDLQETTVWEPHVCYFKKGKKYEWEKKSGPDLGLLAFLWVPHVESEYILSIL